MFIFRPSLFFSNTNLANTRWLIFLATALYSVTGVIERVEQKVIRYDMVNVPVSKDELLNTMVTSWPIFWAVSLAIGLLFGWFIWYVGGCFLVSRLPQFLYRRFYTFNNRHCLCLLVINCELQSSSYKL